MNNLKKVVSLNETIQEQEAVQKELRKYAITKRQVDAVLKDLVSRLDEHFIVSVFNFSTEVRQGDDLEFFVEQLDPSLAYLEEKLRAALPDRYPAAPGEPDSDLTTVLWKRERVSYAIGVIAGAKLAGASDEKLNALRKHVIL